MSTQASADTGEDYKVYRLSAVQRLMAIVIYGITAVFVSLLFYHSVIPAAPMMLFIPLVFKGFSAFMGRRRRDRLVLEFADAMRAYASSIRVGYSPESAVDEAISQLSRIYTESSLLKKEFVYIKKQLSLGRNIEDCLKRLASRSGIDEMERMAEVFAIAKRSGGSLPDILSGSVRMLEDKTRMEAEIKTIMSSKKLEQRIMCLMPAGILLYVNISAGEFISALYSGFTGRAVMTVFLLVYVGAVFLGERFMRFEV